VGELSPKIEDTTVPRRSRDKMTNSRAPWLIEVCELYGWNILNGLQPGPIACNTFHRGNDTSCIDLILSNITTAAMECDPTTLTGLSDHTIITTTLKTAYVNRYSEKPQSREQKTSYKWIEGKGVSTYATSAHAWLAHT
jgi:hypothetical protein